MPVVGRKHQPGCPCCEPFIECPARLRVRVRDRCSLGYVSGATVTARDVAAVLADVIETTDADGWAELEVAAPNTFDVHVTVGTCTEIVEGVELVDECEVKTLPDVAPCCGELCVEVYDYDSGLPIVGAEVAGLTFPATDAAGLSCITPFANQQNGFVSVYASGYIDVRGTMKLCLPCDCTPDAVQNHPVSMFADSVYVAGVAFGFVPDCAEEPDCLLNKTARPRLVFKRVMTTDFTGPEAIFGSASSGVTITYDPAIGDYGAWVGWTTGGYGYKVTRVYDAGTNSWTETARERFDFPSARVRVIARLEDGGSTATTALEWANFIDAGGTIAASPGYVFETSGTRWTTGYTIVELVAELYCDFYQFPFAIRNDYAPAGYIGPSGFGGDPYTPGPLTNEALDFLNGLGLGGSHYRASNSGMCAPVDVAGAYWRGFTTFCGGPYDTVPSAAYALYE